jgi:hypothetical protein
VARSDGTDADAEAGAGTDGTDAATGPGPGPAGTTGAFSGAADTGGMDGTGASRIVTGPPIPGRNPGIPNCSDSTSACNSRDASTPAASRRSEAAIGGAERTVVAWDMLGVGVGWKSQILPN